MPPNSNDLDRRFVVQPIYNVNWRNMPLSLPVKKMRRVSLVVFLSGGVVGERSIRVLVARLGVVWKHIAATIVVVATIMASKSRERRSDSMPY